MGTLLAGVDLGGTYIKTVLISPDGEIRHKIEIPSDAHNGPETVIRNICKSIHLVINQSGIDIHQVRGIGIGSPGPLDTKSGIVRRATNLPGWRNIQIREPIEREFGIPANLENDGNCAAYGEYWKGAGQGAEIMIAYTLGTGVGGGIILHGKLIRGVTDGAGELGHMTIVPDGDLCTCGNRGCVEAYASATAVVRRTREKMNQGVSTILRDYLSQGKKLSTKLIDEARHAGDSFAADVLREAGYYLGIGISSVVSVLNPDIIVVGGGMMRAGEIILQPARQEVRKRVFPEISECVKIIPAKLGNDAGMIGAAGLLLEKGIIS